MASFNRIILVGNITRDLDLRTLPSGMPVLDLGLAVNDRRKDSNGNWVDETLFIDVSVWARNAEILAENARKGSPILVEGRLKMDTWETDGQKRTKFKVTADRVVLLGPRPTGGDTSQQAWAEIAVAINKAAINRAVIRKAVAINRVAAINKVAATRKAVINTAAIRKAVSRRMQDRAETQVIQLLIISLILRKVDRLIRNGKMIFLSKKFVLKNDLPLNVKPDEISSILRSSDK